MDPAILSEWNAHVQQATTNLQTLLKIQAQELASFKASGQALTDVATSDSHYYSWQNLMDHSRTLIEQARTNLAQLQSTTSESKIMEILEDAGRLEAEGAIDTSFQHLV